MVRTDPVMSSCERDIDPARHARCALAFGVVLVLLALMPFAGALEIHHALAAADHDGHEHSASDLCQWVQHHTGTSILSIVPPVAAFYAFIPHCILTPAPLLSVRLIALSPSRAPPIC